MALNAPMGPDVGAPPAVRSTVLVLGASGYIGQRVVAALAASNWALPIAASRSGRGPAGLAHANLRLDARDAAAVSAALNGVNVVVNCVAGDDESIIAGARALFGACTAAPAPPRIVHLSTMQVYGTATGLTGESAPLRGDWDGYSAAKRAAEEAARPYASVVVLRPGIVYGPASPIWSVAVGRWLLLRRMGDLGAAGTGVCNLVHVDDVVEAALRAARLPGITGEAFNLGSPVPPTWNGYFELYARALGVPLARLGAARVRLETTLRAPLLKAAQVAATAAGLSWQPAAPLRPWFLRLCRQGLQLDVSKAEARLGMRWKPLEPGLAEAAHALLRSAADAPPARVAR